ncbi:hypothetical protein RJ55_05142 [Drechmeria coniospora]|nr:hypothetical protein RJ55_05142 [Drechmeria coniospora]
MLSFALTLALLLGANAVPAPFRANPLAGQVQPLTNEQDRDDSTELLNSETFDSRAICLDQPKDHQEFLSTLGIRQTLSSQILGCYPDLNQLIHTVSGPTPVSGTASASKGHAYGDPEKKYQNPQVCATNINKWACMHGLACNLNAGIPTCYPSSTSQGNDGQYFDMLKMRVKLGSDIRAGTGTRIYAYFGNSTDSLQLDELFDTPWFGDQAEINVDLNRVFRSKVVSLDLLRHVNIVHQSGHDEYQVRDISLEIRDAHTHIHFKNSRWENLNLWLPLGDEEAEDPRPHLKVAWHGDIKKDDWQPTPPSSMTSLSPAPAPNRRFKNCYFSPIQCWFQE